MNATKASCSCYIRSSSPRQHAQHGSNDLSTDMIPSMTAHLAQAAFTPKELRELLNMEGVSVHIPQDTLVVTPVDEAEMKATRLKRRVYDILLKASLKSADRWVACYCSSAGA